MRFSDIQLSDKSLWQQITTAWNLKRYDTVLALLKDAQLNKKVLNAEGLNALTDLVVQLENTSDPTFKQNKIPCQVQQPTQQSGEVWFQVE